MMHSIKNLIGFTLGAIDGEIGKVEAFYFDDQTWTVRYLIVETGSFLFSRKVLISPQSLLPPDWEKRIFLTNLTQQQIENSPCADTKTPDSTQQEMDSLHLYSTAQITKYYVNASDGEVGFINDLLVDDTWKLNFIIVNSVIHPPAKKILVPPGWIKKINKETATIIVDATVEKIKSSPEYYPNETISEMHQA